MRFPQLLTIVFASAACLAQAKPAPGDSRTAKLYDVGDLVHEIGAPQNAEPNPPKFGIPGAEGHVDNAVGIDAIAQLLRAFAKPKLRSNEEINSVGERWIVALGRAEQHAWIDRFLATARGDETEVVTIDCRCLTVPEITYLRQIRPALLVRAENPNLDTTYLTEVLAAGEGTKLFLSELEKNKDVTLIAAQKLDVMPLHIAHMAKINQTAYVRDFEIEVAKDAFIADPIVDVVQDGILMQAAVSPLENGRLGLSLDAIVTDLQKPIPTFKTTLAGTTHEVTIQLPSLKSTQLEAAVELTADEIVVMALPPLAGNRILFLVTVTPTFGTKARKSKKLHER